jgi:hypothetical protein
MFPGMSHFLQHQAPSEVNSAMEGWLKQLPTNNTTPSPLSAPIMATQNTPTELTSQNGN